MDCLKECVQNLFGSDGKWCSTGGSAKSFRPHQTSITWYTDTNSLTFHGEEGKILKDLTVKSCKSGCVALGYRDRVSMPIVNNNSYCARGINPQECHNCRRLSAEITEVNQRVDGLHQIVNNLYLPILYGPLGNLNNIIDKEVITRENNRDIGINTYSNLTKDDCNNINDKEEITRENTRDVGVNTDLNLTQDGCNKPETCSLISVDLEGVKLDAVITGKY